MADPSTTKGLRQRTDTQEIDSTIIHPGSVKINVQGAFIVDQDAWQAGGENSVNGGVHDTKDIRLPNHTAVVSHIAVDIGGTLAKLVYFSREPHSREPGGRLNFMSFETDCIDDCVQFMKQLKHKQQTLNGSRPGELCVMATGGGAYKYYDKLQEALGVDVIKEDEMLCLIIGLDFFITEIPREVFTYSETDPMHFEEPRSNIYPYLLVNIGSGVSMIKVSGPREFQRVGGTSLGGGTLWGLLSLLSDARTFDEMLGLAERGDNANVDMLVGDIYGMGYDKIGLKSTTIASTAGKVFRLKTESERDDMLEQEPHLASHESFDSASVPEGTVPPTPVLPAGWRALWDPVERRWAYLDANSKVSWTLPSNSSESKKARLPTSPPASSFVSADLARSLLYAISNNIGQIAYLQSEKHNLREIYFGGSFIRGHRQTMNTLSYAIKFWSRGEKRAYFLRHEGYLGAVGAFLKRQPWNWGRRGSFEEGKRPSEIAVTALRNEYREYPGPNVKPDVG